MNTIIIVFYWLLYLRDHVKGENASKKPLMLIFIPFMVISFISIILSFFGVPIMYTMTPWWFEHFMYAPIVLMLIHHHICCLINNCYLTTCN